MDSNLKAMILRVTSVRLRLSSVSYFGGKFLVIAWTKAQLLKGEIGRVEAAAGRKVRRR
jgi:hypothetical protein